MSGSESDEDTNDLKLSLKVMVNKEKNKVLFSQVDNDFLDILLSFLTLPLSKILGVLKKHYEETAVVGSLTALYESLESLDGFYYLKNEMLDPIISYETEFRKLKLNVDDTQTDGRNYNCGHGWNCKKRKCIDAKRQAIDDGYDGNGVFVAKSASFVVSDDLRFSPIVSGSTIRTLTNFGITDIEGAELMDVSVGYYEIVDLLEGSLLSDTPLSEIVLHKIDRMDCEQCDAVQNINKVESSCDFKNMIVKAAVQISTNKLLFAEVEENFVRFLYGLLTIPLGGVEFLLGGNSSLKNIDNLYRSIASINNEKYLKTKDTKSMLLKPKLLGRRIYENQIYILPTEGSSTSPSQPVYGRSYYSGEPKTYMVTDDLNVTPFCMFSSITLLNELKAPLTDVKEVELNIGLEEAVRILKASLTSASALTDALITPMLENQTKKEN